MIPASEFLERVNLLGKANMRNCDNEIEEARYQNIKKLMLE